MKCKNYVALTVLCASIQAVQAADIEEVILTVSPLEKTRDAVNKPVGILSGDELRKEAASTIGETLESQLGVSSASFGPGVGLPVIRGQSSNRVKVMQDSINSLDVSNVSADHAVSVEPLLAERIEVLRGPATLRYGSGAIGGVVNVIDQRIPSAVPEQITGALELRHNSVNDQSSTVFKLDGGAQGIAWHVDGLYRDSNDLEIDGLAAESNPTNTTDGYIANTDRQMQSGTVGLSSIGERGYIGGSVSYFEDNYGIPPEDPSELVRIAKRQTRYDVKGQLNDPFDGFEKLTFRAGYNDYQHIELEDGAVGTVFDSDAFEARAELVHSVMNGWRGAIGAQLFHQDFSAVGDEAFIPASVTQNLGVFIVEEYQHDDWLYELGARIEDYRVDAQGFSEESFTNISLSTSVQWLFSESQSLTWSLSRSQRAPSVEELFSDGAHLATSTFDVGNAQLEQETSINTELGYAWRGDIDVFVNVFYNHIDDFIYQNNTGVVDAPSGLNIFQYEQQQATFKGVEAEVTIPVTDEWQVQLFGDSVRAEFADGNDVPRITPSRVGFGLLYQLNQWDANLRFTKVSQQNRAGALEADTDGYNRLDLRFNYAISDQNLDYMIFVKGNNLLDEEIRNSTSFLREIAPAAGRGVELGVRVAF